jgi:hypothetical protein
VNLPPAICPECRAGKHRNCDSTAWCDETAFPTACDCWAADHEDQP